MKPTTLLGILLFLQLGALAAENDAGDMNDPSPLVPATGSITVGTTFDYKAPPDSLTVINLKSR